MGALLYLTCADFDVRLSRRFRLGEKANLQLIAEGFNLANHTNFASVNNVVGLGFGLPTAVGGGGFTTFNVSGTSAVGPSKPLGFTSAFPKREIPAWGAVDFLSVERMIAEDAVPSTAGAVP